MKLIRRVVNRRLNAPFDGIKYSGSLFLEIMASKNTMEWEVWCFWKSRKDDLTREQGKYNIFSNQLSFSSSSNHVSYGIYLI